MRRKYPTSTDTRGMSCCCTPAPNSQLYPRLPQPKYAAGSNLAAVVFVEPNPGLVIAPHSPFAAGFVRSHCGTPSPGIPPAPEIPGNGPPSNHKRFVEFTKLLTGFGPAPPATTPTNAPTDWASRYLFALTLIAVFPSPP